MTRSKRPGCHHCGGRRRRRDCGPRFGPCHRGRCRRSWADQFTIAKALAPRTAAYELLPGHEGPLDRWIRDALSELIARCFVRTITTCGGQDECGRDRPDRIAFVLTDQGRAHFFLPLPVTMRQHQ